MALESTVENRENAGNQHFLLFPQFFLLCQREAESFKQHLIFRLQMLLIWSWQILSFGKGLNNFMSNICFL